MIGFANPEFLPLLVLTPVFLWWWLRRNRPAIRYSKIDLVRDLPSLRAKYAKWGGAIGRATLLFVLLLAAAGPRKPDLQTRLPAEGIAIVLVLDVSGSMATPDFASLPNRAPITRLDAAKNAFRMFVAGGETPEGARFPGRVQDQIALVTFAAVPETNCPLTHNHTVLLSVLEHQKPKDGIDAGTNIGDAIAEGVIRLTAAGSKRKVIILLSDGEHNLHTDRADGPLKPRQAAQLATNLSIPIYTIDCGGEPNTNTTPEEQKQRSDGQRVLRTISEMTQGRSFSANSADELEVVYREIDELEKQPTETFHYRRYHEYSSVLVLMCLGLFGLLLLLEQTVWRITPG